MDLEAQKFLEENLAFDLEKSYGATRIGDIKENLREMRDEIEEMKKYFSAPEHLNQEEYCNLPKFSLNQERINELKKDVTEEKNEYFAVSVIEASKLLDVFLSCDLIEFFTSNASEEIPICCQAKTFAEDINLFLNLQQATLESETNIFPEVNPSYIRLGSDCYFIQGKFLQDLTRNILQFYKKYYRMLQETEGDANNIDISQIKLDEKKLSYFDILLFYVLDFFSSKEEISSIEEDFYRTNLNESDLDSFLKNRKKIVIKKIWA